MCPFFWTDVAPTCPLQGVLYSVQLHNYTHTQPYAVAWHKCEESELPGRVSGSSAI